MALRLRIMVDRRIWSSGFCGVFFLVAVTGARGGFGLILILILWVSVVAGVGGCCGLV